MINRRKRTVRPEGRPHLSAGQALVEFALCMPLLLLIAFGTLAVSQLLERYLTVVQLTRNAGNMYSRSVDFSLVQNRNLLLTSATGLSMTLNGGDGVVYLTTVEIADSGSNNGLAVVTNRIVIGNASIAASRIGTPATVLSTGEVVNYKNDPTARATVASTLTLVAGDLAYAVEVYHTPTDIPMVASFFGQRRMTAAAYY